MSKRKTYNRMADIPAKLLRDLNSARENPITLAEWLAIDAAALMRAVLPDIGLKDASTGLVNVCKNATGTVQRLRDIGHALHAVIDGRPDADAISEALASHRSTVIREWAAMTLWANADIALRTRIALTRRFAADDSANVRETAWMSLRPHLERELAKGIKLLGPWVRDPDPNIRRCAIEATRPRGVWCAHIGALKESPELGLPLLEPARSDPSHYVRTSVSNWLNDASKSRPEWVEAVCARWERESPTKETQWIVNRGLRTLR